MFDGADEALLRSNATFRTLWIAELARYVAAGLRRVAIPWLVLELTGSPLQLGLAFALETTPDILVAPLIGQAIDGYDRRRLLILGAIGAGGALIALSVAARLEVLSVGAVYGALVAMSVFDSLYHNAREALLPIVVAEARLDAANAYFNGASAAVGIAF